MACGGRSTIIARVVTLLVGGRVALPTAVLVGAPLGGGKSRVLDDIATAAGSKRQRVHRVLTTSASVSVPFGAAAMATGHVTGAACVAASEIACATGVQRVATGMTLCAERLVALCEGALSPGLIAASETVEPLTEREREVAFMSSSGMTSREIAEHLVVSRRTVSKHWQHVYDKLGVRSRTELRHALGGPS